MALALGFGLVLSGCGDGGFSWIARQPRAFGVLERIGMVSVIDRMQVARALEAADFPSGAGARDVSDERPDVLIVVLDTVRRDRLPVYGYASDTMPRLSLWAHDARVYTRARSTSSWTLPAHASLFTGLHPIEHGAHGRAWSADARPVADATELPEPVPTLAEALRAADYATVGIAANRAYLGRATGLSRGFDAWLCDDVLASSGYAAADRITDMALETARRLRDRPLFLFLNYMDAHQPIHVREGYTETDRVDPRMLPPGELWQEESRRTIERREPLDPELVESWSLGYDGELRFLDEHLGRLLRDARALGIGDGDLIVILSDHGESFGEHAIVEHSKHLYGELSRIPLLVRGPGFEAGRDDTPVQIQDVPSWVLGALGIPPLAGATRTDGLQVMELYWTRHKDLETKALRDRFDRVMRAFVRDRHKRFIDDRGREVFYDLATDPQEKRPLTSPPWESSLRRESDAWIEARERRAAESLELSERERDGLRALGYLE